jgi:hypothetical protein
MSVWLHGGKASPVAAARSTSLWCVYIAHLGVMGSVLWNLNDQWLYCNFDSGGLQRKHDLSKQGAEMVFKVHACFKQESDIAGPHNNVAKCEEWLAEACCMGLRTVQSILNVHRVCKFSYQVIRCKRRKVNSMVKFNKNVLGFQGLQF